MFFFLFKDVAVDTVMDLMKLKKDGRLPISSIPLDWYSVLCYFVWGQWNCEEYVNLHLFIENTLVWLC